MQEKIVFLENIYFISSMLFSLIAIVVSIAAFSQNKTLHTETLTNNNDLQTAQKDFQKEMYELSEKLNKRQLIVPLWQYISELRNINTSEPIGPQVVKNINTLELIALCCEGQMVDKQVILRTFEDQYIKHYESIRDCQSIPFGKDNRGNDIIRTGQSFLDENRAAQVFYQELKQAKLGIHTIT